MSVIRFQDFGLRCFGTLTDLMKSGRDMAKAVTDILEREVIGLMQKKRYEPTGIAVTLLQGLNMLIEETSNTHILSELYEYCFPQWLTYYCADLDKCKQNKQKMSDDEHYDQIISLISISVDGDANNVALCKEAEMQESIAKII